MATFFARLKKALAPVAALARWLPWRKGRPKAQRAAPARTDARASAAQTKTAARDAQAKKARGDVPAREARAQETQLQDAKAHEAKAHEAEAKAHEAKAPPQAPKPDVGEFVDGTFDHPAGRRDYKFYIPPAASTSSAAHPLPLVVMLHGCAQDPDDFARGTGMNDAAAAQGFFVLYPAQSKAANAQRCWNWFNPENQHRGRGEPALIADLVRNVMARYSIAPDRVYVAGLSAGGSMAAILGETYPDVFAAVGVHSGMGAGVATNLPAAVIAMAAGGSTKVVAGSGMPTIVFHGDADRTVSAKNAEQVIGLSVGMDTALQSQAVASTGLRDATRRVLRDDAGHEAAEIWIVKGGPHAWSGGRPAGTFTDPTGPDATTEMLRFFFEHRLRVPH